MDLLGDKAEEAQRQVSEVSQRLQDIESHVNALDNALQDFDQRIENVENQDDDNKEAEANRSRIENLENLFRRLSNINTRTMEKLEDMERDSGGAKERIKGLQRKLSSIKENQEELREQVGTFEERIEELEDTVEDLESEFVLDVNRQDWDLENKLEKNQFNNRKKQVDRELGNLRASINAIADQIGEDDLEIKVDKE